VNQTHAGHASQSAFQCARRTIAAITTPTISASAEWRLGIAAYGFELNSTAALEWSISEKTWSVSTKPRCGNIRGGAVGSRKYPTSPRVFASRIVFRKRRNHSLRRR